MRWRGALGCAVLAGLAIGSTGTLLARARNAKLPDWVMAAAAEKTGPLPKTANAVVLYQGKLLTIDGRGRAEYRMRMVVKILGPAGREDAIPAVAYNHDAPLKSFRVWAIGPDGHRFAMKQDQYQDIGGDEPGMLYVDERGRGPGRHCGLGVREEAARVPAGTDVEFSAGCAGGEDGVPAGTAARVAL